MGKSPPSISKFHNLTKATSQYLNKSGKNPKPNFQNRGGGGERRKQMESSSYRDAENQKVPLAEVVSDCVKRWFRDTLKEAKSGDINMQVLVGQMYYSGYGVPSDPQKGRIWITRASRVRSSVWKVSDKRPGYNASDSDSDEVEGDS